MTEEINFFFFFNHSFQINYLVDEHFVIDKGSNLVINLLHHFFEQYSLKERSVNLHCDNCTGQNKNNYMLWYMLWRVCNGLHHSITLNFLLTGHTKFAPDWCFGLLKKQYRVTDVSSLEELCDVVRASSVTKLNVPQLVGKEDGTQIVPQYDWQSFLKPFFKTLPQIKKYHHFR